MIRKSLLAIMFVTLALSEVCRAHRIDLLMDMKVESSLPPLFGVPQPNPTAEAEVN